MNKTFLPIVTGVGLVVLVLVVVLIFVGGPLGRTDDIITPAPVYSFEDCVAQGNPVSESMPRQCRSGKVTFVEQIGNSTTNDPVVFESVKALDLISSPLTVKGRVVGSWCFEAVCPIRIMNSDGKELGAAQATVTEWMTGEMVPFTATITFSKPSTDLGYIELSNDNPSGLPANEKNAGIPVRFK